MFRLSDSRCIFLFQLAELALGSLLPIRALSARYTITIVGRKKKCKEKYAE
jgi:hypothetical protein